ncbi:MAG: XTP/dITP diphosphatase [Clostridia bacterium]|nr:XTP/dITP diphosphatase [Clostridia bacterium]
MKTIIAASNNKDKIREIKQILASTGFEILSLDDAGFAIDPDESGQTFEENALIKARAAFQIYKTYVMADDSGLSIEALNGLPGVNSRRYAGPGASYADNNMHLIENIKNSGSENFNASFICVIALIEPDGKELLFKGECKGVILQKPRGENGFGYDPLFYIPGTGRTMAQMTDEEKNSVSHRGRALQKLKDYLLGAKT